MGSNKRKRENRTLQSTSAINPTASRDATKLPQKRFFRQRAHSNPFSDHYGIYYPAHPSQMDWSRIFPPPPPPPSSSSSSDNSTNRQVKIVDIGCGFGSLLIRLSELFPQYNVLGTEIRTQVSMFVNAKIHGLRNTHEAENRYTNCAVLRSNSMKSMPNFFPKASLQKLFFCFPDPQFKLRKQKARIISTNLLAEYAYTLASGGRVYIITDVLDLYEWMKGCLDSHPLFRPILLEDANDEDRTCWDAMHDTDEGRKVTRNGGDKYAGIYERV